MSLPDRLGRPLGLRGQDSPTPPPLGTTERNRAFEEVTSSALLFAAAALDQLAVIGPVLLYVVFVRPLPEAAAVGEAFGTVLPRNDAPQVTGFVRDVRATTAGARLARGTLAVLLVAAPTAFVLAVSSGQRPPPESRVTSPSTPRGGAAAAASHYAPTS